MTLDMILSKFTLKIVIASIDATTFKFLFSMAIYGLSRSKLNFILNVVTSNALSRNY